MGKAVSWFESLIGDTHGSSIILHWPTFFLKEGIYRKNYKIEFGIMQNQLIIVTWKRKIICTTTENCKRKLSVCLCYIHLLGNPIKKYEMGGKCNIYRRIHNMFKMLVRQPKRKIPCTRPRHEHGHLIIGWMLKNVTWVCLSSSAGSGWSAMIETLEHSIELLGSIEGSEFRDQLTISRRNLQRGTSHPILYICTS